MYINMIGLMVIGGYLVIIYSLGVIENGVICNLVVLLGIRTNNIQFTRIRKLVFEKTIIIIMNLIKIKYLVSSIFLNGLIIITTAHWFLQIQILNIIFRMSPWPVATYILTVGKYFFLEHSFPKFGWSCPLVCDRSFRILGKEKLLCLLRLS